jgi:hypothetical protein
MHPTFRSGKEAEPIHFGQARSNKTMQRTNLRCLFFLILMAGFITGCMPRSSPPGPNSATGPVDGAGYVLHDWAEGLKILVIFDTPGAFFCEGEGGASSPVYHLAYDAESNDGRSIHWQIETSDGVNAQLNAGGAPFSVSRSAIFLMKASDGAAVVRQVGGNLSNLAFDHDSIIAFIQADPAISAFIEELAAP